VASSEIKHLYESCTGEFFSGLNKKLVMKKNEFVTFIKHGDYPNYELRIIGGDEIPVSKKDPLSTNNLG